MYDLLTMGFDPRRWESWLIPILGLLCTLVALIVGRLLFNRPRAVPASVGSDPVPKADPFETGSHTERRGPYRRQGNRTCVRVSDPEQRLAAFEAWVLDRSVSGLRLQVPHHLPEEGIWLIRAASSEPAALSVEVQVSWCRQGGEGWEAGCRFLRNPTWNALLQFG